MKKVKILGLLVILLALCFVFTGCDSNGTNNSQSESGDYLKIDIVRALQSPHYFRFSVEPVAGATTYNVYDGVGGIMATSNNPADIRVTGLLDTEIMMLRVRAYRSNGEPASRQSSLIGMPLYYDDVLGTYVKLRDWLSFMNISMGVLRDYDSTRYNSLNVNGIHSNVIRGLWSDQHWSENQSAMNVIINTNAAAFQTLSAALAEIFLDIIRNADDMSLSFLIEDAERLWFNRVLTTGDAALHVIYKSAWESRPDLHIRSVS